MHDFGREIYSHFPSEILHNLQYFPIFALFCGHIAGVWQNNKGGVRRVETERVGADELRRKNGDGKSGEGRVEMERVEKEQEVRKREEERKYWE